ncbi:MAG: hypothetical protein SVM80_01775 [Halobacteriota archaeon]|nr:hypothetical protein [Halobacteriota archaeon]
MRIDPFRDDERARSFVLGVILLSGMTFTLFGIGGGLVIFADQNNMSTFWVGVTAEETGNGNIIISYIGGMDADKVAEIKVVECGKVSDELPYSLGNSIGSKHTFVCAADDQNHVVVVAEFKDGTEHTVLNTMI